MVKRRLFRSRKNKMIGGVCGGLGENFDSDPTIIRLLWALITVFTGFFVGIIVYLLAWIIIPEK